MALLEHPVVCIAGALPPEKDGTAFETAEAFSQRGWRGHILCDEGSFEMKAAMTRWEHPFTVWKTDTASNEDIERVYREVTSYTPGIDLFIYCTEISSREEITGSSLGINYSAAQTLYDRKALGLLRLISVFLPALDSGKTRRIGFITGSDALINSSTETEQITANMIQAAVHNAGAILFNRLHPLGYTFRVFSVDESCPGPGVAAYDYFVRPRSFEPGNPRHSDESRYTACDGCGRERAW